MSQLFQPLMVGESELQHRVVMAPLTRYRMDDEWIPTPMSKGEFTQASREVSS